MTWADAETLELLDALRRMSVNVEELVKERASFRKQIVALEEQVAHAERARDNAINTRDEAVQLRKQSGESAARRIELLIVMVRSLLAEILS